MGKKEMGEQLGMFAKYWQPGVVKTRLAAAIGDETAATLQLAFIRTLLTRMQSIPQSKVLAFTPAERRGEFAKIADGSWEIEPQSEGDLGQRIACFFQSAFEQGFRRVVLIGSDSPTVPVQYVAEAFKRLATEPLVIGSSADGGFYLVGAAGSWPATIFDRVEWSTGRVWEQVLGNLRAAHVPVAQLPPWYDVDEAKDLRRLAAELVAEDDKSLRELSKVVQRALEAIA